MITEGQIVSGFPIPTPPLDVQYDPVYDRLKIEGIEYSGDLFRAWAGGIRIGPTPEFDLYRIIRREDGLLTIQVVRDRELAHRFDLISRAGL